MTGGSPKSIRKRGVKVVDMDEASFAKWRAVAQESAYPDYAAAVKNGKQLLDLAMAVK